MIRKVLAFVLAIVFILLAVPLAFSWGSYNTFTSKDLYDERFVDIVYDFSIAEIASKANLSQFAEIERKEFTDIMKKVISKDDLGLIIDGIYDQISTFSVDEESNFNLVVPLDWFEKNHDVITKEVSDRMYATLAECEDLDLSVDAFVDGVTDRYSCVVRDVLSREDFAEKVEGILDRDVFSKLPTEFVFSLFVPFDFNGNAMPVIKSFISGSFFVGIGVLFALLLFIGLLIFKPFSTVLKWEAKTICSASFLVSSTLLVILLVPFFIDWFGEGVADMAQINFFTDLFAHFFGALAKSVLIYSLPLFVVSLIFWIVSVSRSKGEKESLNSGHEDSGI